jgi:predicted AAA+ superfamily ATPase
MSNCNYKMCYTLSEVDAMPITEDHAKEATFNLRVDSVLKAEFTSAVEAEDRPAAEVLRGLMRNYVDEARRRRFAAEARRQSQLVAASTEEAEVMRWIQDVSATQHRAAKKRAPKSRTSPVRK